MVVRKTFLNSLLNKVAIIALGITLILALNTFVGSEGESEYIANKDLFYRYSFLATIVYFVAAYFAQPKTEHK